MAVKNTWVYDDDKTAIVLPNGKPGRTKKLTGTRFAAALGFNRWKTPFQVWCEITRVAEPPFEGNKFTEAGLAIEPKLVAFVAEELAAKVIMPKDYWGSLYEERKYGFFKEDPIFDGMWDALELDAKGEKRSIIECKTTKRAQDWADGAPPYYLAQALLYAALEGLERVIFAVSFLEEGDYAHPEEFVCTDENSRFWFYDVSTTTIQLDGREYDIHGLMDLASRWWGEYVHHGVSPEFDESADAEYLKILRTANPTQDTGLDDLVAQIAVLEASIAASRREVGLDDAEKALKAAKDALKRELESLLGENDEYAEAGVWRLTRSVTMKVNEDALKDAGVFDKYAEPVESLRLAKKSKKDQ